MTTRLSPDIPCIKPILNKAHNYRLWSRGAFGTKLRVWRNYGSWLASDFSGKTVLRYMAEGGSGPCVYNLSHQDTIEQRDAWLRQGYDEQLIVFHEAAPDQHVVLQGEIWNGGNSMYDMIYSTVKAHMRPALAQEQRKSSGLASLFLIKSAISPSSWEDLNWILGNYPDHAVEFSIYSTNVGDLIGRNTIVWEVRAY
jgi:hypothetical protein